MPSPAVRKATMADIDQLATSLARAFEDDPVMAFIFPAAKHLDRIRRFFRHELTHFHLRNDESWTTVEGIHGGALWSPPNKWKQSFVDVARMLPMAVPALGRNLPRALRSLSEVENAHPPGEHYYLSVLGTDPSAQGKGVGSALLEPVLNRCDEQGLGAYLESSKEKNIPFYNRHGFEVTREVAMPGGGPSVWLMWREPRD